MKICKKNVSFFQRVRYISKKSFYGSITSHNDLLIHDFTIGNSKKHCLKRHPVFFFFSRLFLVLRVYVIYVVVAPLYDSWKVSIELLQRNLDPDSSETMTMVANDVIIIEDFLFRELSYAGGVSHHEIRRVTSTTSVSIHEFNLSFRGRNCSTSSGRLKHCESAEWWCIKETRGSNMYATHAS